MKKKKWKTGRLHLPGGHKHQDNGEADIAARLTPLEETAEFKDSPQSEGHKREVDDTIRVGSSDVRMPGQLIDDDRRDAASIFHLEPIVVALLVVLLGFVAFVAWQITLMPEK